jgi:hypothetical protein
VSTLSFDGRPNDTPVGYYTYTVADDHWTWSDALYAMHGHEPLAVPATTALMLSHKHPDDAVRAFEVLEKVILDGHPYSCFHRIIDAKQQVRRVLSVGRGHFGADGRVEEVSGYFVDLTGVRVADDPADDDAADQAQLRVAETRSGVERAKGVGMVAHGCDDAAAFALLRRYAAAKGMRLSDLARAVVEEVAAEPLPEDTGCRTALEAVLEGIAP